GEDAGWLLPGDFGDPNQEYERTYRGAAFFDTSHHGKVQLAGPDAASFLHNLCTNEILKLLVGKGCEAFVTTNQAKIVAYVLVYRHQLADGTTVLSIDAGPGMGEGVARHLDRYLISEQVEIADRTTDWGQLHLAGPQAAAVLQKSLGFTAASLRDLEHTKFEVGGIPVIARAHRPLGIPGFDLLARAGQATRIWNSLVEAGATPAGIATYHVLRVEA